MTLRNIIFIAFITILTLSSCEKVIDLDIKDSDKRIVLEAELYEGTNQFNVLVSESSFYNESGLYTPIDDATVSLEDDAGNFYEISHDELGRYSEVITALPGHTYTLKVAYEDKIYKAVSYMPQDINIENLISEFQKSIFSDESGHVAIVSFEDPANQDNFYRIKVYEDDILLNTPRDLRIYTDNFTDGVLNEVAIRNNYFESGKKVKVELMHMDETGYDYLSTLGDIIGSSNAPSPTPSNPVTNWTEGAMGAFVSYNTDTSSVVIP